MITSSTACSNTGLPVYLLRPQVGLSRLGEGPDPRSLADEILVAFPAVLQLTAAVLCFLARDGAAASALCVLATTWLSIGAVFILSRPGSTSGALGLHLLVSAAGLGLSATAGRSPSSSSRRCCWWPGCASR